MEINYGWILQQNLRYMRKTFVTLHIKIQKSSTLKCGHSHFRHWANHCLQFTIQIQFQKQGKQI